MPGPETLHRAYIARVNRVVDHIEANLSGSLTLEELAKVAHFSPFHFHRIFTAIVGETLGRYVQRQRLERAANVLISDSEVSVTQVALECGFSSPSTFARAFKSLFGQPANEFRNNCEQLRKQGKASRNHGKVLRVPDCYLDPQTGHPTWRYDTMTDSTHLTPEIQIIKRPAQQVVYL
ncbi:MAG: helix-turn-helix domain-containing protein, partial [Nannocystaceae bacterium]